MRNPGGDADLLRIAASAANETVDAIAAPPSAKIEGALDTIVQRYGRVLAITQRDLKQALHDAGEALRGMPSDVPTLSRESDEHAELADAQAAQGSPVVDRS